MSSPGTPKNVPLEQNHRGGYEAPYSTPQEMHYGYENPQSENLYKAPTGHLRHFGCWVSRPLPEPQRRDRIWPAWWWDMYSTSEHHDTGDAGSPDAGSSKSIRLYL